VPEPMRVRLLGGFGVFIGVRGVPERAWRLKKAAGLTKLLALAQDHRLHQEQVMEILWPALVPKAASNNLRQALYAARRALEPDPSTTSRYLRIRDGWLTLCAEEPLWVDVEAFERAVGVARRVGEPEAYRAAIDLYAGDLLPEDRYEEWVEERREALRQTHLALLVEMAALHEERGEWEPAIAALGRAVEEDPVREEAHVGLMRLFAASGKQREAILQYERLQRVLSEKLDAEPAESSRLLHERLVAGQSGLSPSVVQSITTAGESVGGSRNNNLPAERTSFVGREDEMVEVGRLLAMTRLLTLTGVGGAGKTRFALALAGELSGAYPDGVWLVELAPLSEGGLVEKAVTEAVGVREEPGRSLAATLKDHLSSRELLLVVDNCEHLIEAVALLVETLLNSCENLRVLATSREPLNVVGELTWQVAPLSVPDTSRPPTVGELAGYGSVRLFVERARYRRPEFALTPENASSVAEICHTLDGMPLAIELAAARAGAMSVDQISGRLASSFGFLSGSRTAPPRQRTLKGALDWSYDLLSEGERTLFGRLSVFARGWSLEAAEAVGAGRSLEKEEVLELLLSLVDKSLVVVETDEAEPRYRMLEPIRQYGRERLEQSGSAEEVRRRHARWYLALAERAAPELRGPSQRAWVELLEREHDDLRAAASWFLESEGWEQIVRLGWALWLFWWVNAHLTEGRRWMEEALDSGHATVVGVSRAKALFVAGTMADLQADRRTAQPMLEESLNIFREQGDERGAGFALGSAGLVELGQGRLEEGISHLKEGADYFFGAGEMWGAAVLALFAGAGRLRQGDLDRAQLLAERGLALSLEADYKPGVYVARYTLGRVAYASNDRDRAMELYEEALRLSAEVGNDSVVAYRLEGLADVAASEDEVTRAARLWAAEEALLETIEATAEAAAYPYAPDRALHQSRISAARERIDEETFLAAWSEGRAMTLEEVVPYALSRQAQPTTPSREPPTIETSAVLTFRQREIAALIARRLTNRQIASELTISEHTVATHVRRILKKLDLRSRSQIATWLEDQSSLP
jgi:predicted ATPase/DNA-binding SARP family transcriptional activator/DNA-binding CsgD family transcriptional regulator